MLAQMRQLTRSIFARILLGVLALAFAIWGVNDAFNGMNRSDMARVGDQSITPQELERDFTLWLDQQRGESETPISRADAIEQRAPERILDSMINRIALHNYASRLGLDASDQLVAARIRQTPAALNPINNSFDEGQYQNFLREIRYTHAEFVEEVRADLSVRQLMHALVVGARAPRSYGALGLAFESERRRASVAEIPATRVGAVPAPTDAQLQALYRQLSATLRVPEFRALTIVSARPADFVARVDVPEARILEEFNARRATLEQPERRTLVQISAPTEAQARDAAARLGRGEEAASVARALNLQVITHDNRARTEIPDGRIARAAFGMQANAVQAVQGALSPWAAIQVRAITPASAAQLADHREDIRAAIAQEEAADLMNTAVAAFNDARAQGAPLAAAARAHGLNVVTVAAVTAEGRGADGQPASEFVDQPELLSAAFATAEGEATDFIPGGEGADVIVQVDSITPARVRPLAQVRPQIAALWTTQESARRLQAIGQRVIDAVAAGRGFADAVRAEQGQIVVRSQEIDRQTAAQRIPARQLGGMMFAGREGEVVMDVRIDGQSLMLAHIEQIQRADPADAANAAALERWRGQLQQSLMQSMSQAVEAAVRARADVRRNATLIERTYGDAADAQDSAP